MQFRLGTLFLLLLVFFAWFGYRIDAALRQERAVRELTALGAKVWYEGEKQPVRLDEEKPKNEGSWLYRVLGRDFFDSVVAVEVPPGAFTDKHAPLLEQVPDLERAMRNLPRLRELRFADLRFGDARLEPSTVAALNRFPRLELVCLPYLADAEAQRELMMDLPQLAVMGGVDLDDHPEMRELVRLRLRRRHGPTTKAGAGRLAKESAGSQAAEANTAAARAANARSTHNETPAEVWTDAPGMRPFGPNELPPPPGVTWN